MVKSTRIWPKNSLEARARALAPPDAIRIDAIAEEIVDHLRPWRERKGNAEVTRSVHCDLLYLLILAPHAAKRGDRKKNRNHARHLDDALAKVETLLSSAPLPLGSFLLTPLPTMTDDGVIQYMPPSMQEDIERANRERADSFIAELKRMRRVCARAIDPGFGYDPNYDRVKHFCAMFARGLMRDLSDKTITGTKDGAFRAITSLLYEAVSGRRDADLKRACDSILRGNRAPRPGTD